MNPWDLFTWIAAVVLAGGAVVIFIFFLRDAGEIFARERSYDEEE
jgi:hypothetical protein